MEPKKLAEVIEQLGPLEWRALTQSSFIDKKTGRTYDYSRRPPHVGFRSVKDDQKIIERLGLAVEDYKGKIRWHMLSHKRIALPGINYLIEPLRMMEIREKALSMGMSASEYLEKFEPEFGPVAYDDLAGLTDHVRGFFPE